MFLVHDRYLGEAFLYITYAFFTGLLLFRFRGPLRRFGGDTFWCPWCCWACRF